MRSKPMACISAQLSESTLKALIAMLPLLCECSQSGGHAGLRLAAKLRHCLKFLLHDENVDGVMVILPPPPMFTTEEVADTIIPDSHLTNPL